MNKKQFIAILKDPAKEIMKKHGLLASVTLGQAALESGWLSSELYKKANNPFGIKGDYNGEYVTIETKEEKDGKMVTVKANFRKYPDLATALEDRTNVLLNSKNGDKYRYRDAVGVTDPREALTIIKNGGYATASDYVDRVMKVITDNNFTKYDKEVIEELKKEAEEKEVVDNEIEVKEEESKTPIYRVRLSYEDAKSQIGAFADLNRARALCDKNPGYKVFTMDGVIVYEVKKEEPVKEEVVEETKPIITTAIVAGMKLDIKQAGLYYSTYADKPTKVISNMVLYIYDGKKFKDGMYRVCKSKSLCNTSTSNVYGYININDITLN